MIDIGGTHFIIDLDAMEDKSIIDKEFNDKTVDFKTIETIENADGTKTVKTVITSQPQPKEFNSLKYETIRLLLEVIFSETIEIDDTLGTNHALSGTSLSFKFAFNTLNNYGIIKIIE